MAFVEMIMMDGRETCIGLWGSVGVNGLHIPGGFIVVLLDFWLERYIKSLKIWLRLAYTGVDLAS
jgi:hypothetical protein